MKPSIHILRVKSVTTVTVRFGGNLRCERRLAVRRYPLGPGPGFLQTALGGVLWIEPHECIASAQNPNAQHSIAGPTENTVRCNNKLSLAGFVRAHLCLSFATLNQRPTFLVL